MRKTETRPCPSPRLYVAILSAGAATSMAQPGNSPLGREAAEAESMADRLAPMEKLAYAIERAISKAPHGPANVRNAERELAGEPRRDQEAKKPESELLRAFHLKALAALQKSTLKRLPHQAPGLWLMPTGLWLMPLDLPLSLMPLDLG